MGSNLSDGFAIYPMVDEGEATGVVAGVYAALLTRMPFVPSLFKSFALCPHYLVLAYEQSTGVLYSDALKTAGQGLGASHEPLTWRAGCRGRWWPAARRCPLSTSATRQRA